MMSPRVSFVGAGTDTVDYYGTGYDVDIVPNHTTQQIECIHLIIERFLSIILRYSTECAGKCDLSTCPCSG